MEIEFKQEFIWRIAKKNQNDPESRGIRWSRHSITKLVIEGWTRKEIEEGIQDCSVIEDYPLLHRSLPDCLVLGRLKSGEPFHAVVAIDEAANRLFVVTVYGPLSEEWEVDWRTRKE